MNTKNTWIWTQTLQKLKYKSFYENKRIEVTFITAFVHLSLKSSIVIQHQNVALNKKIKCLQ